MQDHELENATSCPFAYERTLRLPAHVTCLALGGHGHLYVGSSDGSLRVYDLQTVKVVKAIQALGDEVASVACLPKPNQNLDDVFLSVGRRIMSFGFPEESTKMIQKASDALMCVDVGDEDDVLNELSISPNKSYLAFCCDSGTVGVLDISTKVVTAMKAQHSNICGCVKFIPHRPSELLSAGYDHALHHYDFMQRKLLSVYQISASEVGSETGMSLSPPFIMSTAVSAASLLAAGTADGRLFIGLGGEKGSNASRNKKSKKWEGLKADFMTAHKVAEGPIVSLGFNGDAQLTTSTLLGTIARAEINRDGEKCVLDTKWSFQTKDISKVNGMVMSMDETRILIGGLTKDGGGVIEIWSNVIPTNVG